MQQLLSAKVRLSDFEGQWKTALLGEVVSIRNHKVLPSVLAPDTPCVELEHIGQADGRLLATSTARDSTSSRYAFQSGDVLFGRLRPYLRKYLHADFDGICTTEIWPLMADPDRLDGGFLYAIVQSEGFMDAARVSYGTHMPRADWSVLQNLQIRLPSVREQCAIVEVLSDVDAEIVGLDRSLDKTRAVQKSMEQQLLTGKARLFSFRDDWKPYLLGAICTFLRTASNPRSHLDDNGDVEYIHYGDIHAHRQPILDRANHSLPRIPAHRVGNATPLRDGDLVMVDASEDLDGVGKGVEVRGIADVPVVAGLHTILCRGNDDTWARGFKAYLQFIPAFRSTLARLAAGTSVYAISARQLATIELRLPPRLEQAAIVGVLSDMATKIDTLEQRLDKSRAIKQGMMQQLLTGRVRLVEPAATAAP